MDNVGDFDVCDTRRRPYQHRLLIVLDMVEWSVGRMAALASMVWWYGSYTVAKEDNRCNNISKKRQEGRTRLMMDDDHWYFLNLR